MSTAALPATPAIRIVNASKSFNRRAKALHGVNARVLPGECVGLLGASGSGKSTLLRSLCGLERLDGKDSAVELFGKPLQSGGVLSPDIRSLFPQTFARYQTRLCQLQMLRVRPPPGYKLDAAVMSDLILQEMQRLLCRGLAASPGATAAQAPASKSHTGTMGACTSPPPTIFCKA